MTDISAASHERGGDWDAAYLDRGSNVSWFQAEPQMSLQLIEHLANADTAIIDVGGGTSFLVDRLIGRGFSDLSVLDVSQTALETVRRRVSADAPVTWLCADLLTWRPQRHYGLWHDRAVFHFLTDPSDRDAYLAALRTALEPGGSVVLATFAADGPEYCSGLPVARYSAGELTCLLGEGFTIVETRSEHHTTPSGGDQPFTWITARTTPRR
ncbi:MAG: hypothetical protein QOE54_4036 [Streptosporangiaceae bacterium]|jgi:SAM-dependent methyltransferase|nr:binding protein [Streptosporangiaceae bacterium]MDX6431670.1 hypothetical protein [Streptosporangiaceae bacterium]